MVSDYFSNLLYFNVAAMWTGVFILFIFIWSCYLHQRKYAAFPEVFHCFFSPGGKALVQVMAPQIFESR